MRDFLSAVGSIVGWFAIAMCAGAVAGFFALGFRLIAGLLP